MSSDDDRSWKAEDLLEDLFHSGSNESGRSMQDRIEQFFDADREAQVRDTTSKILPTSAPIEIPDNQLIRCLGTGGFGQVWLARNTLTNSLRACKLIDARKGIELDGLSQLMRKVLPHHNLLPIEDVRQVGEWLVVFMPLAIQTASNVSVFDENTYTSPSLLAYIQRLGARPPYEVAAIGEELIEAVRHLHANYVVHRDIKPANILPYFGKWCLADYGLARDLSAPTGSGGTPRYTPPEGNGTPKADQYAMGVVLLDLLTGRTHSQREDLRKHTRLADGDFSIAKIILRATDPNPDDRFGSMDEFKSALVAVRDGHSPGAISRPAPSWWRRQRIAVALIGAAILAVVCWRIFWQPLRVTNFEIQQYRLDQTGKGLWHIGSIGDTSVQAHVNDQLVIHARFSKPAFVYLLALDPNGTLRPCLPESADVAPTPHTYIDYPSDPSEDPDGFLDTLVYSGSQAYLLLASETALPPWSEWVKVHGQPAWGPHPTPLDGMVIFDGTSMRNLNDTRGPQPRLGKLLEDPISWGKMQKGMAFRFIAFPVFRIPP